MSARPLTEDKNDPQTRLAELRKLVREGEPSTQEELCDALRAQGFDFTQSTVSRDLRKIGAVKATNAEGEIIYVLPEDHQNLRPRVATPLTGMVTRIEANESLIVLHSIPGAASLVARHIDTLMESFAVLGTIAGDDTVVVVPKTVKNITKMMKDFKEEFL
jgi:transcriptional regulator of arginine metabolism